MSSSYLGHGAKYWADRYFEQHTQTRLPDDHADLSWREKYLALEKNVSIIRQRSRNAHKIEYLRSQQPTSIVADPDLQRKAEKWKLGYTRLAAALKRKEKQYDALSAEKQRLGAISRAGNSIVEKQLNNGPNCIFLSSAIIKKPLPICKRAILKSKR